MQWSSSPVWRALVFCALASVAAGPTASCTRPSPGHTSPPSATGAGPSGAGVPEASAAAAPRNHTPTTSALEPAPPVQANQQVDGTQALPVATRALLTAFPVSESRILKGPVSLRRELGALSSNLSDHPTALVFLVDREANEPLARVLSWAMAAQRAAQVPVRGALVSFGMSSGARLERPFGDAFELMRAAGRTEWSPASGSIAASWQGLIDSRALAWPTSAEKHVVLLSDDRESGTGSMPSQPLPAQVAAWAREERVQLHLWRCQLESEDGDVESPEVRRPARGLPLDIVAGLFRDGAWLRSSAETLAVSAAAALNSLVASEAPVELAVAIDTSGRTGELLAALRPLASSFQSFLGRPGNRLALVGWDTRAARVAQPLSRDIQALTRALTGLRPGPLGDTPKDLFGVLGSLGASLKWSNGSKRAVLLVSAAPAKLPVPDSVLEWSDREQVSITVLQLTN